MSSLVEDEYTRAATFFTLAFGLTAIGGVLIGDVRLGVEWGLGLGVAFGAFAYFFIRPTTADDHESGADDRDSVADDHDSVADDHDSVADHRDSK